MKLLICIFCFFTCSIANGQINLEEVVYLKDGSSLRGTIIEQVPNEMLKIQTKDGSIFVCKFSDVEKITKEKVFVSPYFNSNSNLAEDMKQYKKSGIGLTTTGGAFLLIGSSLFAGGRSKGYVGPGKFITGITFLCMSAPFLISGPIMLSKYKNAKRTLQKQTGLSFMPSIKIHHTDGNFSNMTSAFNSYGAGVKFTF